MQRFLPYVLFFFLCALLALRDVGAEISFRHPDFKVDPIFSLFWYCLAAQIVGLIYLRAQGLKRIAVQIRSSPPIARELARNNLYTLISFTTYFLALKSPLGAALTSSITFGLDPIMTAALAAVMLGEKFDRRFVLAALACLTGIVLFSRPALTATSVEVSRAWGMGLAVCLINSATFSAYVVSMKRLMNLGMRRIDMVFSRLFATTIGLGVYCFLTTPCPPAKTITYMLLFGAVTFAIPQFLFSTIIRQLRVQSLSLLLFLVPILTGLCAWLFGLHIPTAYDFIALLLMVGAVASYELLSKAP